LEGESTIGSSLFRKQCALRKGAWGASPPPSSGNGITIGREPGRYPVRALRGMVFESSRFRRSLERKRNCHAKKEKEEKEVNPCPPAPCCSPPGWRRTA
jgi:hypothetical protein